ncbi:MAG TPA: ACP S-malonyltransferase, partial [Blastocatellia bacterium]|nr:ACP S-malonyltransferase [Blastocatellia bacterium]
AIIGCEEGVVIAACAQAAERGVCSVANINSGGQTVIAGHRASVEYAVELLKERGARRTAFLPVSAPFHCELMKPAAERLKPLLERAAFNDLAVPLVTNVDAQTIASGAQARDALERQVVAPVRWYESVVRMINDGVSRFVEIGPGKVLSGLVRQMSREVEVLSIQTPESLGEAVAVLR